MKPDSVTVIDLKAAHVLYGDLENGGPGGENTYLAVQRQVRGEI